MTWIPSSPFPARRVARGFFPPPHAFDEVGVGDGDRRFGGADADDGVFAFDRDDLHTRALFEADDANVLVAILQRELRHFGEARFRRPSRADFGELGEDAGEIRGDGG